uniref:Prefoldin subunit 6 n=2 Tax=Labrus bergylta TaxID=56723 RepID=A0A3Q3FLX4_9LABR
MLSCARAAALSCKPTELHVIAHLACHLSLYLCVHQVCRTSWSNANMAEALQKKLKAELEKYTGMQKDVSKSMSARQKLESQLTDNNIVKEELDLLDSTNTVYKLIGPVLVKQDLDEAKATVTKRLEYINGEIQRYEALLKDMEKKSEQHRELLSSLQQEYQRAQGMAGKV